MSRFTKKELKDKFGFYPIQTGNSGWVANEATDKLGKLEDLLEKYGISDSVNFDYLEKCIQDHDKYGELQEQLGCPLDVVVKALKEGIWITREVINCSRYCKQNQEIGFMKHKEDRILMLFDFTNREIGFLDMADRSELWFVCWVKLSDYKKTWWLKKDKSE